MTRRAIGIVRVSKVAGRAGERFISPAEQRDRIKAVCEREGLQLTDVLEEMDVSGGRPLDKRPGLRAAVEAIESGRANVVAAAYFDRLFHSLTTQAEVLDRVEGAGGQVLAVDVGQVTNGSAGQWLSSTMLGAVAEYYRRAVGEKLIEAQRRAIERGVAPFPSVVPGYRAGPDGVYIPDTETAAVMREAFEMRAGGATVHEVRVFLARKGITRAEGTVGALLANRVYLGEIHFGKHPPNLEAHEPIVDRDLFERVQRERVSGGRLAKSERLLARLGVLCCGSCGSRMVVGHTYRGYYYYLCGRSSGDPCPRRMSISAEIVEGLVVDEVKRGIGGGFQGTASAATRVQEAEADFQAAQTALDNAIEAFTGLEAEPAAVKKLRQLRAARDEARDHLYDEQANAGAASLAVTVGDWDELTLEERRGLIRAVIERVVVKPGRGAERVVIEPKTAGDPESTGDPPVPREKVLDKARAFIADRRWQVARSMPDAPHEYNAAWHPNQAAFDAFLQLIRDHGRREKWRKSSFTYLYVPDDEGVVWRYWSHFERGARIINRARVGDEAPPSLFD